MHTLRFPTLPVAECHCVTANLVMIDKTLAFEGEAGLILIAGTLEGGMLYSIPARASASGRVSSTSSAG